MLSYFFFPTGRDIWLELARTLEGQGVARPVVWCGDSALDAVAVKQFPDLCLVEFEQVHTRVFEFDLEPSDQDYQLYTALNGSAVKEKCLRMMDRNDPYGCFRYIDRDAYFKFYLCYSIYLLKRHSPDFLLMSESPHSPFQYVLYEVAREMKVHTYSFVSWSIAPLVSLRQGIDGEPLLLNPGRSDDLEHRLSNQISGFLDRFCSPSKDIEPEYIKLQRKKDHESSGIAAWLKAASQLSKEVVYGIVRGRAGLERGALKNTRLSALEPVLRRFLIKNRVHALGARAVEAVEFNAIPDQEYVYFPLHYEPERTTNPDGLDFYDQFQAILALRNALPDNVTVLVKEHYSQFTSALHGYKGRSTEFYRLVRNIQGVSFIDAAVNSKEIIQKSLMTATITGSAALESALLGVPALIFGNPWFRGAPGIFRYRDGMSYEMLMAEIASHPWDMSGIKQWLHELARERSLFLAVNPSNTRYFATYYKDDVFSESELTALAANVKNVIVRR